MNESISSQGRWDLDYLTPEAPAQGRWRGGPVNHRLRWGNETLIWHPGDGDRQIGPADGVRTLQLDDADRTLEQVMEAIRLEPDSAGQPVLRLGEIAVQDVRGTLLLDNEQIRFAGVQRIVIGGYSAYPGVGA